MNHSFLPQSNEYPKIIKIRWDKPSELQSLFESVILKDVPVSRVKEEMVKYVTTIIEPVGWKAIWRANGTNFGLTEKCDIEVEVIDVSRSALVATVIVNRILWPKLELLEESEQEILAAVLRDKMQTAPLSELYVINENEEEFRQTAVIVEHVRFFFNCLWRPWDDMSMSASQDIFVQTYLQPRLNLYFEIQSRLIPDSTINKITRILEEGWKIKRRLDELSNKVETDADSLSESVDESDMYETVRLRLKLEDLERVMKLLEDPYTRPIAASIECIFRDDSRHGNSRSGCILVVSNDYNLSVVKKVHDFLEVNHFDGIPLNFFNSINDALKFANNGDRLIILPGIYSCEYFEWIDFDVVCEGIGKTPSEVVIESSETIGDVFINCSSANVELCNLTLRATGGTQSIVVIHSGTLKLTNCILEGEKVGNTLLTRPNGQVCVNNCSIVQGGKSPVAFSPGGDTEKRSPLESPML